MKVVAVFPKGGEAAKNEKYVNCEENALGLRDWAKENKAELVVTSSKDGDDSGTSCHPLAVLLFVCVQDSMPWSMTACCHMAHTCMCECTCAFMYLWVAEVGSCVQNCVIMSHLC